MNTSDMGQDIKTYYTYFYTYFKKKICLYLTPKKNTKNKEKSNIKKKYMSI